MQHGQAVQSKTINNEHVSVGTIQPTAADRSITFSKWFHSLLQYTESFQMENAMQKEIAVSIIRQNQRQR